jgi:hypothetical protein
MFFDCEVARVQRLLKTECIEYLDRHRLGLETTDWKTSNCPTRAENDMAGLLLQNQHMPLSFKIDTKIRFYHMLRNILRPIP